MSTLSVVLFCLVAAASAAPQLRTIRQIQPQLIRQGGYVQPQLIRSGAYPLEYSNPAYNYQYAPAPHHVAYNALPAQQIYRQPLISGAAPRTPAILRQAQDASPDGAFTYGFESEDGISVQTSAGPLTPIGPEEAVQTVTGSYTYTAPDGTPITTNWIADENGFRAEGAHLPRAPEGHVRLA